jgi:hypothetical protein
MAKAPEELPTAVAEMLGAEPVTQPKRIVDSQATEIPDDLLRIPSPWTGSFVFAREGEPFTPSETARAHRLAALADIAAHRTPPRPAATGRATPPVPRQPAARHTSRQPAVQVGERKAR